LSIYFYF